MADFEIDFLNFMDFIFVSVTFHARKGKNSFWLALGKHGNFIMTNNANEGFNIFFLEHLTINPFMWKQSCSQLN